jgi:hypothetical protein
MQYIISKKRFGLMPIFLGKEYYEEYYVEHYPQLLSLKCSTLDF